jgi:hypothetical protein
VLHGNSVEERTSNHRLAKQFFDLIGRKFGYNIERLATPSAPEFIRTVNDRMNMEADEQRSIDGRDDPQDRLEALPADLEADLELKILSRY